MENAGREDRFARELMEAKAGYEKELSFRVKESVAVLTADLVKSLDAAMAGQADLAAALEASDRTVDALNKAAAEAKRDSEVKVMTAISEGLAARRAELEAVYAKKQAAYEEDCQARLDELNGDFTLKFNRLAEENAALRKEIEKEKSAAAQANARSVEFSEKLLAAEKAFHDEKIEMQKAQIRDYDSSVGDAVAAAVELSEDRLRHAQEELEKMKKTNREEVGLLREGFEAEKDQLLEELGRRDRYIESADAKLQELENAMIKYRQTASGELMKNISEQDRRFRELADEEKARGDARIKQLESLLSAKEKLLADGDKFYRQKQLELDSLHSSLNMRINGFNQDIFAQKQELSEKEKALNEYRLKLEKEYALKNSELERMKAELSRTIIEYRKK
ncbi:MAG: hypothetical protein A3I76_04385 [Elusimicrobia bacterium RIFCSPLOWO2_02_FULL_61_11]|nr:MAG: hypothetical protein A3I76_04385 [Elusimicrobia bacterium RIFCSPLOWO2_02_FULL_61_11]